MLLADCYEKINDSSTEIKSSVLNSVEKRRDEAVFTSVEDHGDEVYRHVSSISLKHLDVVMCSIR